MGSEHLRLPDTVSQNRYSQSTSTRLGEILKFKEDHHNTRNNVTIGTVLNLEKRSSQGIRSGRTLLDIIQADSTGDSKITWTNFREKLRLKRASTAMQRTNSNQMTLSARIPTSDPDIESQSSRIRSSSLRLQTSLSALSNEDFPGNDLTPRAREEEEEEETEGEGPLRMSLMSLLAETDREMGIDSAYAMEDEVDEGEVEVENDGGGDDQSGDYNDCCVCMVRHKGSAFIPCGHTFCRLCSRELYVQRGNCPICNGFISEILDIF